MQRFEDIQFTQSGQAPPTTSDPATLRSRDPDTARTEAALRQTINALSTMPDFVNFVPAVLKIVAEALGADNCSYYEHRRNDLIRLRYWCFKNRVYSVDDIVNTQNEYLLGMRHLFSGFNVPDSHLGSSVRQRSRATVVDHRRSCPPTIFADFCKARGWELELNVPLVVEGEAEGALVIARGGEDPFQPHEVSLAEQLGHQLALAIEVNRLTLLTQENTIVRERELAARQRADELARHSELLTQTIDCLVGEKDFLQFIGRLLSITADQFHTPVVEYWTYDEPTRARLVQTCRNGVLYLGSDEANDIRVRGIAIPPVVVQGKTLSEAREMRMHDMTQDALFTEYFNSLGVPVLSWCAERGVEKQIIIPLLRKENAFGALCFYVKHGRILEQTEIDLATSLAQQLSLAVRMTELAEQSRQTAVAREKELLAQEKASELYRANSIMRATLEQLSNERDLASFPRTVLKQAMAQIGAHDGVVFVVDQQDKLLRATDYILADPDTEEFRTPLETPLAIAEAADWRATLTQKTPITFNMAEDGHWRIPVAADWHRKRATQSIIEAPILVSGKHYGFMGLALRKPVVKISAVDLGLIHSLVQQTSLAIQLTRLAEESNQRALALERREVAEVRAAEFAHANEVLRTTLDDLARERDWHSFPRTILNEAMQQSAASAAVMLYYQARTESLCLAYFVCSEPQVEPPAMLHDLPTGKTPVWQELLRTRSPVVLDLELDSRLVLSDMADWHRQRGNRSLIAVPLFVAGAPFGCFIVSLPHRAINVSKVSVGMLHALAQQATLAIQLTQLADVSQKRAIALERQQVIVQERAHMAREIHDKLAQGYAAILMQQKALRRSMNEGGALAGAHLDSIERLAKENLAEARRIMHELKFSSFEEGCLRRGLLSSIAQSQTEHFTVRLSVEGDLPPVPRYVESEIGRVVAEALSNARVHSGEQRATVSARRVQEQLTIAVTDDGAGFDISTNKPSFGIPSMHERAARAGVELEITSVIGQGTQVKLTLSRKAS